MDANEQFEALRELLHRPPGARVWEALCAHLTGWPSGESKDLALAYTEAHLTHWDDRLRQGPIELWWPSFPKGMPRPEWMLVRALCLGEPHIYMRPKASEMPPPEATRQITSFQLTPHNTGVAQYAAFIEGLGLSSLRALHIENHQLGEIALQELLTLPWISSLSRLDFAYNHLAEAGMNQLIEVFAEGDLSWLNICANELNDHALDALVESPIFANLMYLDIGFNYEISVAALKRMLSALSPGQLHTLRVDGLILRGEGGVPVVASHSSLTGLSALGVSRCQLGDQGTTSLANSPFLGELESLDLASNRISHQGAMALGQSRQLQHLVALNLSYNPLGALGLQAITRSPHLREIAQLQIKGVKL